MADIAQNSVLRWNIDYQLFTKSMVQFTNDTLNRLNVKPKPQTAIKTKLVDLAEVAHKKALIERVALKFKESQTKRTRSVSTGVPKFDDEFDMDERPRFRINKQFKDSKQDTIAQEIQIVNSRPGYSQEPDYLRQAGQFAHNINKLMDTIERSTQDFEMSSVKGSALYQYPHGSVLNEQQKINNSDSMFGHQKDRIAGTPKIDQFGRREYMTPSSMKRQPVIRRREVSRSPQVVRAQLRNTGSQSPKVLPRIQNK